MKRITLSKGGPSFSRIVAGAWRWTLSVEEIEGLIHRALEIGMTTFDNADIYGDYQNETLFGKALERNSSLRNKMEIVTKCGIMLVSKNRPENTFKHYNTSKEHIVWSAENSLKLHHTDRIDLLLIHRPDPLMNAAEVADAFTLLKKQGKVLHFGVSNFTTSQFELLQSHLDFPLVTNQLEISLTHQQYLFDGTVDHLMKIGVVPMAWSPLGGGKLVAHPSDVLAEKARKYQVTPSQLVLAWLLRHPSNIVPVVGTTKPERLNEAAVALDIQMDRQDWYDLWSAGKGSAVP
ncbi:aldo/keto reductase [Chryseolinea sp. T2]|uniref:aldo/keto reductase n=1 Tax=Chryseolinea sp. T2 TaxID=3129255 RepID=UPI0030788152